MKSIDLSKYSNTKKKGASLNSDSASEVSGLSKLLHTEIKLFEKKFGAKQKESFYTELGVLISAGVDIQTTFEIIEQEMPDKKHKALITSIKEAVIGGKPMHAAFSIYSEIFTNYEIQSIKIGEETGKLSEVFTELGKFYNSAIRLRRQIVGTLTYPVIVISLAGSIVYFMLSFVVPMFNDIFKQTGGQLPEATKLLIKISNNSSLIFYTVLTIVVVMVALHKTQKKKKWYRKFTSELFLRMPLVNNLIKKIYLTRFCQSMRLLISAKVLFTDALALVESMIGYYPIEVAIRQAKEDVIRGSSLHQGLLKHSIFPPKLIALIKVSEEVNAPELIFEKLEKQYSEEIEHQQAVVGKVMEPFIIIILGLIIGFILVAMYLPLFQISNGF
ncbi:MAG: type II secretion system F family protein [Bacteroidia bacterium]|nr:type II secretion system F family protein [Bacteroidia bacterium]